jgi:hypothetical protein
VRQALDTEIKALDEDKAYAPEIMDVRGAIASLPEAERADVDADDIPSYAQVWALGFMYAIESWPEEWEAPKDKDAAKWHDLSLQAIVALTEDDTDEATLSALSEDGPPSVSENRLNAYGEALWAVYDLREIWRNIGPRVQQVIKEATPGRNDPCSCGSGKSSRSAAAPDRSRGMHAPRCVGAPPSGRMSMVRFSRRGRRSHRGAAPTKPSNHPICQRVAGRIGQLFRNEVPRRHGLP